MPTLIENQAPSRLPHEKGHTTNQSSVATSPPTLPHSHPTDPPMYSMIRSEMRGKGTMKNSIPTTPRGCGYFDTRKRWAIGSRWILLHQKIRPGGRPKIGNHRPRSQLHRCRIPQQQRQIEGMVENRRGINPTCVIPRNLLTPWLYNIRSLFLQQPLFLSRTM